MILSRRTPRSAFLAVDQAACLLCQWRSFSTSYRCLEDPKTPATRPVSQALKEAPRAYGEAVTEFNPKPLDRPIGLPNRPQPSDNVGIDFRTLKQRRDDFVDYDKHIERRKQLTKQISKPYFREWSNMRLHKGKSFLAPPRLFKGERALYFPNYFGQTLETDKVPRDTTTAFEDKISVVSVFSSAWAEGQAASFASEKANPELHEVIRKSKGLAQMVQINIEEDWMKHMLVKMFMYRQRKALRQEDWGRYFLIKKGLSNEVNDAIGFLNSKVGYTYLLDGDCKIRWAGSGPAGDDEKDGLAKGVSRLVEELKTKRKQAPPVLMADAGKALPAEKLSQAAA